MEHILDQFGPRVEAINKGLIESGIALDELAMLDHLCYRTETLEEYHEAFAELSKLGESMGELEVMGRPIGVIAFREPVEAGGWKIPFLEVAAPKEGSPYPSGLEHAEFVPVQLLKDFEAKHAELNFIRDAMTRRINPELKYREKGISVKFHTMSLGRVIELEALGIK